jgi:hypothetical protein
MARLFARYLVSTHKDPDWSKLTTLHHDCYMALVSSPDLSWAGVAPYFPARYVLAADLTERKVARVWDELAALDFLIIDKPMGEVCVRTFLKHDEVLKKPNIVKAFLTALELVRSPRILFCLCQEVATIHDEGGINDHSLDIISEWNYELSMVINGELSPEQFAGVAA